MHLAPCICTALSCNLLCCWWSCLRRYAWVLIWCQVNLILAHKLNVVLGDPLLPNRLCSIYLLNSENFMNLCTQTENLYIHQNFYNHIIFIIIIILCLLGDCWDHYCGTSSWFFSFNEIHLGGWWQLLKGKSTNISAKWKTMENNLLKILLSDFLGWSSFCLVDLFMLQSSCSYLYASICAWTKGKSLEEIQKLYQNERN